MTQDISFKTLPKDLVSCEIDMLRSLVNFIESNDDSRISINLKFEGLKIGPVVFRLVQGLIDKKYKVIVVFSDIGSAALAKRDYKSFTDNIYTYKDLIVNQIELTNTKLIAVAPQPYDYEEYEALCNKYSEQIIMINGKLEETAIGVGYVGRERRINFIRSWNNIFWIQPLEKGAIYKKYPGKWNIFKYQVDGYTYCKSYDSKPDADTINSVIN